MEISSPSVGDVLDVWESPCLLVHWLFGCLWLGALSRSSSIFSETKLETSFSTVSHFVFLALTQSSKVLKWTLLVLYLISGVLKRIKFSLTFLTVSWKAIFSYPDLPMVLKEVCLFLFLTKSLSRMCTGVLKGVNFYMKGLEMSLKFCGYVLLWGLCWLF